jgi:hypothetical protein
MSRIERLASLSAGDRIEFRVGEERIGCEVLFGEHEEDRLVVVGWHHPGTTLCRVTATGDSVTVSTRHSSQAEFRTVGAPEAMWVN